MKNYFFYPVNEKDFKNKAKDNFVRTIVFDKISNEIKASFCRSVNKVWEQSRKNNIETDHRIKNLEKGNYEIYSWITNSKSDFNLPFF